MMPRTAILIGDVASCARLERQLDLMEESTRPVTLGWVLVHQCRASRLGEPGRQKTMLGTIEHLEGIIAHRRPAVALLSLPAACKDLIASIRTRLRRLGVQDRFVPTLEDLVEGVGPRSHIDIDVTRLLDRPPRHMDERAVRGVIADKRIAITGAGGSIGGELARIVARFEPTELLLIERSENALFEIDRQIARRHPEVRRRALLHDVVRAPETLELFREIQPQVIFHTAAHKHVPMMEDHPRLAIENNFFGTVSVADAAIDAGTERFVFISTDKAVNPVSIMGASKRLAELYVQHLNALRVPLSAVGQSRRAGAQPRKAESGKRRADSDAATAFSIVRFGNVLGSAGSVLEVWAKQIADGGPVTLTHPEMTRYFMTIPEAASLVIQSAALAQEAGEVFLLDMGEPVKIVELAHRFIEMHGLLPSLPDDAGSYERSEEVLDQFVPDSPAAMSVIFTGIRPGEKLHEELAFDAEDMRPTRHPDINIWILPPPPPKFVREMIGALTAAMHRGEPESALTGRVWDLISQDSAAAGRTSNKFPAAAAGLAIPA